jgi:hypothetical protein
MRKLFTVLLIAGLGLTLAEAASAQQAAGIAPQQSTKAQATRVADSNNRSPRYSNAHLLAATTPASDRTANLNLVVTPTTDLFYPDNTLRAPLTSIGRDGEAGLLGVPPEFVYRTNLLRSLFPIDEADASTRIGVYVQANF